MLCHHPPLSITSHHQQKYIHHHPLSAKIYPPSPTTTHYQPKYILHYPPPANIYPPPSPTIIQHISKKKLFDNINKNRIRLNYATTHHELSPSTTTHYQPKYIYHHPTPPTTNQNISTTIYHFPKNGPPPRKSQNIFIYNLLMALF